MVERVDYSKKIQHLKLISADTGKNLVTDEVKQSILAGNIKKSDVMDTDGKVKDGFGLFDVNGNGKADDLEWNYFSSGGTIHRNGDEEITAEDLYKSVRNIDRFDTRTNYIALRNGKISNKAGKKLYDVIEAGHFMADNIDKIKPDVKENFMNNLDGVVITGKDCNRSFATAPSIGKYRRINFDIMKDKETTALVSVYEGIHSIQEKKIQEKKVPRMSKAMMEAQALYVTGVFRNKIGSETVAAVKPRTREGKLQFYNDTKNLSKNSSLSRAEVLKRGFLNNKSLLETYIDVWKKKYTKEDIKKMLENEQYPPIGDMNFSKPGTADFSE